MPVQFEWPLGPHAPPFPLWRPPALEPATWFRSRGWLHLISLRCRCVHLHPNDRQGRTSAGCGLMVSYSYAGDICVSFDAGMATESCVDELWGYVAAAGGGGNVVLGATAAHTWVSVDGGVKSVKYKLHTGRLCWQGERHGGVLHKEDVWRCGEKAALMAGADGHMGEQGCWNQDQGQLEEGLRFRPT